MEYDHDYIVQTIKIKEKLSEKNKTKRALIVIILVSIITFCILIIRNKTTGIEILWTLITSFLFGLFYFYINSMIFSYLFSKSEKENKEINELRKKYYIYHD